MTPLIEAYADATAEQRQIARSLLSNAHGRRQALLGYAWRRAET